ncbi:MAG: L-histidine N(alpha)-methyltransferase [Acidobacteriota bacterium]|nr:L-histidine N(alpha)-methyltransferase [Acidobacteriota bacterium]
MFAPLPSAAPVAARCDPAFLTAVARGLTASPQKTLPASWLYDAVGSALFEVITLLPEYGLTRADGALLQSAAADIIRAAHRPELVVELGSGSGVKTRPILGAATDTSRQVQYHPIDISLAALNSCEASLQDIENLRIQPVEATYLEGIDIALAGRRPGERALILFLGSTIGNFDRPEAAKFLRRVHQRVTPGDSLLLGTDLVKPRATLLAAYDDSIGVTAAFNLNILARINRELGGGFDLKQFAHEARHNESQSRVEMHLRSLTAQHIPIDALHLTIPFKAGETIWTESSHKFRPQEIGRMGEQAGWSFAHQWIDREWGFAETLFTA